MLTTNAQQQLYVLIAHTVVAVLIVTAATILAALHDIDGQALTAILGAGVGLVGGNIGSLAIVGFTSNGKSNGTPVSQPAQPVSQPQV